MRTVRFQSGAAPLPVGKILCLGRNYAEHAKEMHAETPAEPIVFLKPSTAIISDGESVVLPLFSHDVHHEVEMVVVIGTGGRDIPRERALDHVAAYAVGLDMTLRDVQSAAKSRGLPWTVAKGFETSAPLSAAAGKDRVPDPHRLMLSLRVNGNVRQRASTSGMIFPVDAVISYLSTVFMLEPGDLIFTGTPEGVAAVHAGDVLEAELEGVASLRVTVRAAAGGEHG